MTEDDRSFDFYRISTNYQWWLILLVVFGILASVCNLIIIIIILRKQKLYKSPCNKLLLLQLSTNFMTSILCCLDAIIHWIFNIYLWSRSHVAGRTFMSLFTGLCCVSFTGITFLTIDRFTAIKFPYVYNRINKMLPKLAAISALLNGTTMFLIHFFTNDKISLFISSIFLSFSIIVLCIFNFYIYRTVKEQFSKIFSTTVGASENGSKTLKKKLQQREMKSTRICLYVVVSYLFCWTPIGLDYLFRLILREKYMQTVPLEVGMATLVLGVVNGIADPFIYTSLNGDLKRNLLSVLYCRKLNH